MHNAQIIAITLSEFQAWLSSGELKCSSERILAIEMEANGKPRLDLVKSAETLELIPYVDLEEEHNVLLAQLALKTEDVELGSEMRPQSPVSLRSVYFPIRCLRALYPLTRRGKQLVASRFESFGVRLEEPLDEASVNALWLGRTWRRVVRGGDELLRTLVQNWEFIPSKEILSNVREAVEMHPEERNKALASKGLVPNVLCYDRHKAITNADIGYIGDLGVVLKERFGDAAELQQLVNGLRAFYKEHEQSKATIAELLSTPSLCELLLAKGLAPEFERYLVSLVLFLKWKYIAQKAGALSFDVLMEDLKRCSGKLTKTLVEQAIWIFGAYCGFEKIASEVYRRRPQDFAFVIHPASHAPCVLAEPQKAAPVNEEVAQSAKEPGTVTPVLSQPSGAALSSDGTKPEPAKLREDSGKAESSASAQTVEKDHSPKKIRKPRSKASAKPTDDSARAASPASNNSELKLS